MFAVTQGLHNHNLGQGPGVESILCCQLAYCQLVSRANKMCVLCSQALQPDACIHVQGELTWADWEHGEIVHPKTYRAHEVSTELLHELRYHPFTMFKSQCSLAQPRTLHCPGHHGP